MSQAACPRFSASAASTSAGRCHWSRAGSSRRATYASRSAGLPCAPRDAGRVLRRGGPRRRKTRTPRMHQRDRHRLMIAATCDGRRAPAPKHGVRPKISGQISLDRRPSSAQDPHVISSLEGPCPRACAGCWPWPCWRLGCETVTEEIAQQTPNPVAPAPGAVVVVVVAVPTPAPTPAPDPRPRPRRPRRPRRAAACPRVTGRAPAARGRSRAT